MASEEANPSFSGRLSIHTRCGARMGGYAGFAGWISPRGVRVRLLSVEGSVGEGTDMRSAREVRVVGERETQE